MVSAAMTTTPAFNARAVFTWKSDRQYRIYVMGDQLVFIRTGGQQMGQMVARQFGLIGALIWFFVRKRQEGKAAAAQQTLDMADPLQLVTQHEHSFRAPVAQLTGQSLEAASMWQARGPYCARWQFSVGGDKMQLDLITKDDVDTFLRLFAPIAGPGLKINVEWSSRKKKYVKRNA